MRLNDLDLNLLVVFDAVYDERNLTRAAETLHVTQPAISNALNRLRTFFGDPLFVRTAEGMSPTPTAQRIVGPVRKALQLIEECSTANDAFIPAESDKVIVCSFNDIAEDMLLPGFLSRVHSEAPGVTVRSYYVPRADVPRELAAGTLDFAVDVPLINDATLRHEPLVEEDYVCAVRDGHPRASTRMTLKRYLALGHVHVSSRRKGSGAVDLALRALGERRTIAARVRHYSTAARIASETNLVCTVPRTVATAANLRTSPLPFHAPPVSLHLYWHKSADADPGNEWMRQLLGAKSTV